MSDLGNIPLIWPKWPYYTSSVHGSRVAHYTPWAFFVAGAHRERDVPFMSTNIKGACDFLDNFVLFPDSGPNVSDARYISSIADAYKMVQWDHFFDHVRTFRLSGTSTQKIFDSDVLNALDYCDGFCHQLLADRFNYLSLEEKRLFHLNFISDLLDSFNLGEFSVYINRAFKSGFLPILYSKDKHWADKIPYAYATEASLRNIVLPEEKPDNVIFEYTDDHELIHQTAHGNRPSSTYIFGATIEDKFHAVTKHPWNEHSPLFQQIEALIRHSRPFSPLPCFRLRNMNLIKSSELGQLEHMPNDLVEWRYALRNRHVQANGYFGEDHRYYKVKEDLGLKASVFMRPRADASDLEVEWYREIRSTFDLLLDSIVYGFKIPQYYDWMDLFSAGLRPVFWFVKDGELFHLVYDHLNAFPAIPDWPLAHIPYSRVVRKTKRPLAIQKEPPNRTPTLPFPSLDEVRKNDVLSTTEFYEMISAFAETPACIQTINLLTAAFSGTVNSSEKELTASFLSQRDGVFSLTFSSKKKLPAGRRVPSSLLRIYSRFTSLKLNHGQREEELLGEVTKPKFMPAWRWEYRWYSDDWNANEPFPVQPIYGMGLGSTYWVYSLYELRAENEPFVLRIDNPPQKTVTKVLSHGLGPEFLAALREKFLV